MKVEKSLTLNTGGYQSIKIGVTECENFDQANEALAQEIINVERKMGIQFNNIKNSVES